MRILVVLCLFVGFRYTSSSGAFCADVGETFPGPGHPDHPDSCVSCVCEADQENPGRPGQWKCNQTCSECPERFLSTICHINMCDLAPTVCAAYSDATCVIPNCEACQRAWYKDGHQVDCGDDPSPEPEIDPVCPADRPLMQCNYEDVCSTSASCPAVLNARCLVDHCGGCNPVFIGPGGHRINCSGVSECPRNLEMVSCLSNPCDTAECSAAPTAECIVIPCGECRVGFMNDQGQHVNCTTGEASFCPPGLVQNPLTTEQACAAASCQANPMAKCFAKLCIRPGLPMSQPFEFFDAWARPVKCLDDDEKPGMCPRPSPGFGGICMDMCSMDEDCPENKKCCSNGCGHMCMNPAVDDMRDDACPPGRPFMNCSYEQVCSAPCAQVPSARCLVDHCGGCRPVHLGPLGQRMDCLTGQVTECPPDVDEVSCDSSLCNNATCSGDPLAVCVVVSCKECHIVFTNAQKLIVDCETGQASLCPPGFVENQMTTEQACAAASCPANQMARCFAKPCIRPGMPTDQLFGFYDARARLVKCFKDEKPDMCPRPSPDSAGICAELCRTDEDCLENKICCSNGCGHTCTEPVDEKPGMCPQAPTDPVGSCVEMCSRDMDCQGRMKCCHNGCGRVCSVPIALPGSCPTVPFDVSGTCVEECMSKRDCDRGEMCCSNGCGHVCVKPTPVMCGVGELEETCDHDPCEYATCPSRQEAVCLPHTCGRCRPRFFFEGEEVNCDGQKFCKGLGGDDQLYRAGTSVDSSDGCNQCVCTGQELWICSRRKCLVHLVVFSGILSEELSNVVQITLSLNGTLERILLRKDSFIANLKRFLAQRFKIPAENVRDFKLSSGSIVVKFKVSSNGTTDVYNTVEMMKTTVAMGEFSFKFDGDPFSADPASFQSAPFEGPSSTSEPPANKDRAAYIAIGVIAGVVIIVALVSLIACLVKSQKAKSEKKKTENLEFQEHDGAKLSEAYNA